MQGVGPVDVTDVDVHGGDGDYGGMTGPRSSLGVASVTFRSRSEMGRSGRPAWAVTSMVTPV